MKSFFELIKIKHWIKNFFVFAPLVFSINLFSYKFVLLSILTFFSFCFVSVFVYILNDIIDRKKDLNHPIKKLRPIASGKISILTASIIGCLFFCLGISLSFFVNLYVTLLLFIYVFMNVAYSLWLKNIIILDVFIISVGFCIRVLTGCLTINVQISHWMLLATFGLTLFLGFCKRFCEIEILGDDVSTHRKNYTKYTTDIIDKFIIVSATIAAISYSLYTMDVQTVARFGDYRLTITIPFVVFGLFRYMYLVYCENKGSNPEEIAVNDIGIVLSVGLWFILILYLLYFKSNISLNIVSFF